MNMSQGGEHTVDILETLGQIAAKRKYDSLSKVK